MLSSGNIPDLFDPEELDAALQEIKTDGQIEGILVEDKNELNKYLVNVNKFLEEFSLLYIIKRNLNFKRI